VPTRQIRSFFLSISFHHGYPFSYIILWMNNKPVGGRRSHPIFMMMMIIIIRVLLQWGIISSGRRIYMCIIDLTQVFDRWKMLAWVAVSCRWVVCVCVWRTFGSKFKHSSTSHALVLNRSTLRLYTYRCATRDCKRLTCSQLLRASSCFVLMTVSAQIHS
jgi:hypothetical protein